MGGIDSTDNDPASLFPVLLRKPTPIADSSPQREPVNRRRSRRRRRETAAGAQEILFARPAVDQVHQLPDHQDVAVAAGHGGSARLQRLRPLLQVAQQAEAAQLAPWRHQLKKPRIQGKEGKENQIVIWRENYTYVQNVFYFASYIEY